MRREITGEIHYPDESPWKNAEVHFVLSPGSYTSSIQYPQKMTKVVTDNLGKFSVVLWANEEGTIPSRYTCRYPSGESFEFTLPPGGTPATISYLRDKEIVVQSPQYPALFEEIEDYVRQFVGSLPQSGGGSNGVLSPPYMAAQNLSALRIVALDSSGKMVYASSSNLDHAYSVAGLVDVSMVAGEVGRAIACGTITDSSWNWQLNLPIFLGVNGVITQASPTVGFLKQVATPLTSTQIYIDLQETVIF